VRDDNLLLGRLAAIFQNSLAIRIGHVEAIDHHQSADRGLNFAASKTKELRQVRVFEKKRAIDLVVFFVESAAGDEDSDAHALRPLPRISCSLADATFCHKRPLALDLLKQNSNTGLALEPASHKYRRAYIEISNVCNLQCSFCPEVERPKQVLSPEAFCRIADQLPGLVDEVCLHLMGEPLGHPQLAAIVTACAERNLPINLTTNGMLLHGARLDLVLLPIVRQLNISVHSFEANFGVKDVELYMQRVIRCCRAALASRPDLYINLRLWDLGEPTHLSSTNVAIRECLEREFAVDLVALKVDLRRRKNCALAGRIYLHFDSRFDWPSPQLPQRSTTGFCHALTGHFGIHADGTVVPCCLDKEARLALGNLQEAPLEKLLTGERATRMRAGFARGELVEDLCQKCTFVSRFDRKAKRLQNIAVSSIGGVQKSANAAGMATVGAKIRAKTMARIMAKSTST